MAALVTFEQVTKRFGDFTAVDGLTLEIHEREFFALLGPSGCGKTTLLRLLAGFETPDAGRVLLAAQDLAGVPPYRRPVNMMFQSYALFPHMTVAGNVAFGLKQDGLPKDEIAARVEEMLALVQLSGFARAQAGPALRRAAPARRARALARQAAEGAAARRAARRARPQAARGDALRAEGAAARLQTTFVIVTHDQDEAMTVADRIAVMDHGRLAQVGDAGGGLRAAEFALGRGLRRRRQPDRGARRRRSIRRFVTLEREGMSCASRDAPRSRRAKVAVALRPEKIRIAHARAADGASGKRRRRKRHRHRLSRRRCRSTRCGSTAGSCSRPR